MELDERKRERRVTKVLGLDVESGDALVCCLVILGRHVGSFALTEFGNNIEHVVLLEAGQEGTLERSLLLNLALCTDIVVTT